MHPTIKTNNLTKTYRTTTALKNLDLEIYQGEIFGLLGPNGAGKTTTIKLILNLIRPTAGQLAVFGLPPGTIEVRQKTGYLPENLAVHEFLSPIELLRFHGRLCQIATNTLNNRIDHLLEKMDLSQVRKNPIRTFSKGMRQRVGIALALINQPDLLILDEPTSGLDPVGRRDIRDLFLEIRNTGTTIIINSHLLSEIEQACDRVGILQHGELIHLTTLGDLSMDHTIVEVHVREQSEALLNILSPVCEKIEKRDKHLLLTLKPDAAGTDIPELVKTAGTELQALIPRKETLEDLFYRLVKPRSAGGEE